MAPAKRRRSASVDVGGVGIGGDAPIAVQSMTNTPTADVESTVAQICDLVRAGSELVRLTVNTRQAAEAVPAIADALARAGCEVPLIGDFHYNGHLLLAEHPACADTLAKYRINPGNVGVGVGRDDNFAAIIGRAIAHRRPVRIGANWGSVDADLQARLMEQHAVGADARPPREVVRTALLESVLASARRAEELGLEPDRIVVSIKVSNVPELVAVNRELAASCSYPIHLGLTEAGGGDRGIIGSVVGSGILLVEGIGDTVRVSLTPEPDGDRTREVQVARQLLQSLDLRRFEPQVVSCPGCGRTGSTAYLALADRVRKHIAEMSREWSRRFPGVEELEIAVMGCVVNGPGESRHADIGISLPGTAEEPKAPVYVDGALHATLAGDDIAGQFLHLLDDYIERRFGS